MASSGVGGGPSLRSGKPGIQGRVAGFCCQAPAGLRLRRDGRVRQVFVVVDSYVSADWIPRPWPVETIRPRHEHAVRFRILRLRGPKVERSNSRLRVHGGGDGIRTRVQTRTGACMKAPRPTVKPICGNRSPAAKTDHQRDSLARSGHRMSHTSSPSNP